jgi:hypothetical protein
VAAVRDLQHPANAKGMRIFLGMMEQCRKYTPGYALLAAPLQVMMRKSVSVVWKEEAIVSLEALKSAVCSAPVLALPDWEHQFSLTSDWSRVAIGAVLSHVQPSGEEHPVAFASRALLP